MSAAVILGQGGLEIEHVVRVARGRSEVHLLPEAKALIKAGRAVVERAERDNVPVYGLTRGLGGNVVHEVDHADRGDFSHVVVLARACGAGEPLPVEVVRAMLLLRAAGMARGGAGVRPVIVETLIAMLNRGVHPVVPSIGSLGASDLALMANLALPLIGEGRAELDGRVLAGAAAMAEAGIARVELRSKEGLALCSANAASAGFGALVLHDVTELAELMDAVAVLSFEAFRANPSPIDARVVAARPAPGQAEAAASLRRKLDGSALFQPGEPRRVQDPISFRCVSQVHGGLRAAAACARPALTAELNGAGDNPLVLPGEGEILSTGNFHTPALALAFDALALALSQTASLSAARTRRLLSSKFTDLPDGLTRRGATRIGLSLLSVTAEALAKEIRRCAAPATLDDSTGYDVEDHAPMTPAAVRKAAQLRDHLYRVLACELVVASQALNLRAPVRISTVAGKLHGLVRETVPVLDEDRPMTEELEAVARLFTSDRLAKVLTARGPSDRQP